MSPLDFLTFVLSRSIWFFFLSDSALRPSGGAADHLSQEAAFYGDASCWRAAAVCSADINCLSVKYRTVKEELWATGSCDERERERRREEGEEDGGRRGRKRGGGGAAAHKLNFSFKFKSASHQTNHLALTVGSVTTCSCWCCTSQRL